MDNFKIQGKVLIEKLDAYTYDLVETLNVEENDVSITSLIQYTLNANNSDMFLPPQRGVTTDASNRWRIYWSTSEIKQSMLNTGIPQGTLGSETVGSYVDCNVGSPFFTAKVLPTDKNYLTFIADILPGTSTRIIKSLALGHNVSSNSMLSGDVMFTNLNLTTPCIQDNLTVIRVTYRLYYDDPVDKVGYSEFSDGMYKYFINRLKYISDGSLTGNSSEQIFSGNNVITSTFYNPANIDIYKPFIGHSNHIKYLINSDIAFSGDINTSTWYQDTNVYSTTQTLTEISTMGCFFRTVNISSANTNIITEYESSSGNYQYFYISLLPYLYKTLLNSNVSPVKNVFKQISSANTPFQDLSTIGTMTGTIDINSDNWSTQYLPKIVRLNITNSGDNTTATYNYEVGTFGGGFIENTFSPRTVILPQDGIQNFDYTYHRKKSQDNDILRDVNTGGTIIRSPDNTKYFVVVNCQRNQNSISYYNIETGNKYVLNSTSTPALPVTNTSDMAVSNGYTFVTCSNTGLWKISPDFNTVTNINSIGGSIDATKAYQIDVKENGDLWVLFEGGLAKGVTPDNGNTWNWTVFDTATSPAFSATGITNSNWSNVTAMCVDPEHTNDRILFVLGSAASTNNYAEGFIWWERLTGTTTIMTSGVPYPSFSLSENLKRSDLVRCINGYWFTSTVTSPNGYGSYDIYNATYNNINWTTKNSISGIDGRVIPANINNIKSCIMGSIGKDENSNTKYPAIVLKASSMSLLPSTLTLNMSVNEFSLLNGSSSTLNDYSRNDFAFNGAYPLVYLEKSNMLICYQLDANVFYFMPIIPPSTALNYNDYKGAFWKQYGWDGSSWILGSNLSKTCHSSLEPFMDGLDIRFNNGATGTSFVNTEKFTFVVGNGIMKDNATQLDLKLEFYPWKTETITDLYTPSNVQINKVPGEIYGERVDEPLTFSNLNPNSTSELPFMISKGRLSKLESSSSDEYISCEEIAANTQFTIKFKLSSTIIAPTGNSPILTPLALHTGSESIATIIFNTSTGDLIITNSTHSDPTILGTIPKNLLSIDKEFVITRLINNSILFIYDNIIYAVKSNSSKLYLYSYNENNPYSTTFNGYYDMKISYTDFRRMALFGNELLSTGKFNTKFMHTSVNNFLGNLKCTINNIPQTILFTPSYASTLADNQVRYETGSGYLVFNDMPTITLSTSGSTTSPALYPIIENGVITNIVIHKNGSGYTSTPTITISAPASGTTATATVILYGSNSVNDLVTITNAGSGYTPGIYPLSITGGGGEGATGNVYISTTGVVVAVDITNGGYGYTSTPTLSFSGAGTPTVNAVLTAAIGERIYSITLTNGGSGYIPDAGTTITANTIAMYHQ